MKRILLACCLMAAAPVIVHAQSAPQTGTQQIDPKLALSSKANELDANLSRNRTENTQKLFMEAMEMMANATGRTQMQLASASAADKPAINQRIGAQQKLYGEIKMLGTDLPKNRQEIKTKLQAFLELM